MKSHFNLLNTSRFVDKHLPTDIRDGYPNPNRDGTEETFPTPLTPTQNMIFLAKKFLPVSCQMRMVQQVQLIVLHVIHLQAMHQS